MACIAATTTRAVLAAPVQAKPNGIKAVPVFGKPAMGANLMAARKAVVAERKSVATQAVGMEVVQLAGEAGFIGGVAGVMVGITLVGLAFGFILLRVESLAEEGKI